MHITRLDLDGKGMGSPEGLVTAILRVERDLPIPIPITELCAALDIERIEELATSAFDGMLVTDLPRSSGVIIVRKDRSRQRKRFSIGHELGHFLIPTHMPNPEGRFICSHRDMALLTAKESDRRARMEMEANKFSSLLLIPPPFLRKDMKEFRTADINQIIQLSRRYDVSKEAMARAYSTIHDETVAVIICKDDIILRLYKNPSWKPFIQWGIKQPVPQGSIYHRRSQIVGSVSDCAECLPDVWINVERGRRAPALFEQVYTQSGGFSLILLRLESYEDYEEDELLATDRVWQKYM